jgi:Na+/proline symporter
MNGPTIDLAFAVFLLTLVGTLAVSYLGRLHSAERDGSPLSEQRLNKWLLGLSAGATANSGFVVTGAVGLGYAYGVQWLLLPLGWLLGDIVFWAIFPDRINKLGRSVRASAMTDIVVTGLGSRYEVILRALVGVLVLIFLGGYVSAQWLAGEKLLTGAFGFGSAASIVAFAAIIVLYTAIGGFRGSVYADTFQAVIRVIGTSIALAAVSVVASRDTAAFWTNLGAAGPGFLSLAPNTTGIAMLASIGGFAAAALGFGLGQPQIVTRYLAGASPQETRAAWWIYIGFVQATWVAMTIFGILLRGVMPDIADPETGLSLFHRANTGPIITGIIVADIFATIAATSNSLLVAMAQTVNRDLGRLGRALTPGGELWLATGILGAITMTALLILDRSVFGLALSSISLMGSSLAPAVIIRVLGWKATGQSVLASIISGLGAALMWRYMGLSSTINEAAAGIAIGLLAGWFVAFASSQSSVLTEDRV